MLDWILIGAVVGLAWLGLDTLVARDRARAIGARICRQQNLQLLDQTVALHRMWPSRDGRGNLKIEREFRFEFSSDGTNRYGGQIQLLGKTFTRAILEREGEEGQLIIGPR